MSKVKKNMTIEQTLSLQADEFLIDGKIESKSGGYEIREFDGNGLDKIEFRDPETGELAFERIGVSKDQSSFQGTAIFTPYATGHSELDLNVLREETDAIEGKLLVLELQQGVSYGKRELRKLLREKEIIDQLGRKTSDEKYIVLFKTCLMDKILEHVDQDGIPDYNRLHQEQRPGITEGGARYLAQLGIAKAYALDNISFETLTGSKRKLPATQILLDRDEAKGTFVPLVYHVARTTSTKFEEVTKNSAYARIGSGNVPALQPLPGYTVTFEVGKNE